MTSGIMISGKRSSQDYCSHCSKWGHKRADCRARLTQQESGTVAGVQEPETGAEDVKAALWSDVDSEDVEHGLVELVFCSD